jgi:heavy metal translocating P-type ATPase
VLRSVGDDVFAGTVLEEGSLRVRVKATVQETKLRTIVAMVEQSEAYKSQTQERMERLADRIVPWNFLYAAAVLALTRSLEKVSAALMVDYSCALKLTGSIASLAALREAAALGFTVKGSKFFEAMALADTIVFDKTGTLTQATPKVVDVMAFDGWDRNEVLRLSACLEEHFPHPVARAVVNAAAARNLTHRDRHAAVEYIVAHGIASQLDGRRVIIGSGHFVFEDEGVSASATARAELEGRADGSSPLFLAVDNQLVGALCIHDPLKPYIAQTLDDLRQLGLRRVIMLTGDNQTIAARIAEQAGVDEFQADLLPEEKHDYLETLRAQGARVVMVGDGVNDSPALSAADVGIAMGDGADIAREVADITLATDDLTALVALRRLSQRLMVRMNRSYGFSIALNTALLLAGTAGVVQPQTSSLIHNTSTVALCAGNTRAYLPKGKAD